MSEGSVGVAGVYYDPNHGACVRTVTLLEPGIWQVTGYYGIHEASSPGRVWQAHMRLAHPDNHRHLLVDFYKKRVSHERVYSALWCPSTREIHWEDGNVWKKLYSSYDA